MNRKILAILAAALAMTLASATAITYTLDSNTGHVTWTLSCGGTVCVLFGSLSGNSTLINFQVKIISSKIVTNQFINSTVFSGPPNVVYNLNGTTGTHWLFGPYGFGQNIYYNYAFQLKYNGPAGNYDVGINVLQGA